MNVAIVNDLEIAQQILKNAVSKLPYCDIIWTAYDGQEAIDNAKATPPDIILMDLIMPNVDGAQATQAIMADNPNCAILVVTASVQTNNDKVYEAMSYGALDAVCTPTANAEPTDLITKIKKVATITNKLPDGVNTFSPKDFSSSPSITPTNGSTPIIAIGSSTGGPQALQALLGPLPESFPYAITIAQHVDSQFAPGLASWLNKSTQLHVQVAQENTIPQPGNVYIGSTNDHLIITADHTLSYTPHPTDLAYRPSVDALFNSLIEAKIKPSCAILLTGMGDDGARGLLQLKNHGWETYAQDESSCVVYGMPKAAAQLGAAKNILPPNKIATSLLQLRV